MSPVRSRTMTFTSEGMVSADVRNDTAASTGKRNSSGSAGRGVEGEPDVGDGVVDQHARLAQRLEPRSDGVVGRAVHRPSSPAARTDTSASPMSGRAVRADPVKNSDAWESASEVLHLLVDVRYLLGLVLYLLGDGRRLLADLDGVLGGLVDHGSDLLGAGGLFVGGLGDLLDAEGGLLDGIADLVEAAHGGLDLVDAAVDLLVAAVEALDRALGVGLDAVDHVLD